MNRLQRSFYVREFRPAFLAGEPVSAGNQPGYPLVMLHDLVEGRADHPDAMREVRRLARTYRDDASIPLAEHVVADTYYAEGDFAAGFRARGYTVSLPEYLALAGHLDHPRISAMSIPRWGSHYMTKKSYASYDDVLATLQQILDDFHEANGISIIEDFWFRINQDGPVEVVAQSIEDELVEWVDGAEVRRRIQESRSCGPGTHPSAFMSYPDLEQQVTWPAPWPPITSLWGLMYAKLRLLSRAAENAYRDGAGVPRVGQGLVSEMTLLRQLEEAFPNERIVHQARPWWLAPQSLDIYFPARSVGVEYQGVQHSRPVELFGGEKEFTRQQERDRNKRALCESNGCALIEVHPGYDLDDVIEAVRAAIELDSSKTHP